MRIKAKAELGTFRQTKLLNASKTNWFYSALKRMEVVE